MKPKQKKMLHEVKLAQKLYNIWRDTFGNKYILNWTEAAEANRRAFIAIAEYVLRMKR